MPAKLRPHRAGLLEGRAILRARQSGDCEPAIERQALARGFLRVEATAFGASSGVARRVAIAVCNADSTAKSEERDVFHCC
jgi:hypothetical protein